jgi:hypothetical protein
MSVAQDAAFERNAPHIAVTGAGCEYLPVT